MTTYPQTVRGGAGYFPEEGKVILEGYYGAEIELSAGSVPNGDGNSEPNVWHSFVPELRVGGSPGGTVDFGSGYAYGQYKAKEVTIMVAGSSWDYEEIEVMIQMFGKDHTIPDGAGFKIFLPSGITPPDANTSRGGSGDLWIEGGQNSYPIAPKWTSRDLTENNPTRIIIMVGPSEWERNLPKRIEVNEDFRLFFWMKYLIQR